MAWLRIARARGVMRPVTTLDIAVLGYVLGSIPFGLVLAEAAGLGDIRRIGSGNIGATNVLRTGRRGLALGTLLLDGGKGALAIVLGASLGRVPGMAVGGMAAVLGHLFPVWLGFRGGKGRGDRLRRADRLQPARRADRGRRLGLGRRGDRLSSAGALAAFVAAPLLAWVADTPPLLLWMQVAVGVLVWVRHSANIRRLLAGTEPRIGQRA